MGDLDREAYLRHRYGGSQRLVHWRETRHVAALLGGLSPLKSVLDAPSGHGRFTAALAAATHQLTSLDEDLRHLRALVAAEATPPACVRADLLGRLPFADASFELVFCFRFLHHVRAKEERRRLLAELSRVSARYLLLSYYQAVSLHGLQRAVRRALRPDRRPLALVRQAEMQGLFAELRLRVVCDAAILPGVHAQRVVLLERGQELPSAGR